MEGNMFKTSDTHPLEINPVRIPHVKGLLGLTFCPGKKGEGMFSGTWNRDLDKDLRAIIDWGAEAMVSLVEEHEFSLLGVPEFRERLEKHSLQWFHLPIIDVSTPGDRFEKAWAQHGNVIRGILAQGGKVVLHCRGGLGRTGLLAARILTEFGMAPKEAIDRVRGARPGAIETTEQEQHIYDYQKRNQRRNLDHYLGCLLGGAIGDALGAAVEFDAISDIRNKYGDKGIRVYDEAYGRKGAITDDTQMTLFTAEGLLRAATRAHEKGFGPSFPSCTYSAYRRWLATQGEVEKDSIPMDGWLVTESGLFSRRAPGNTCLSAIKSGVLYSLSGENRQPNSSKGCGAVMRMAPVGLFVQSPFVCNIWGDKMRDEKAFEVGRDLGYLTHGHPDGYLPAAFLALLIGRLIDGDDLNTALDKSCEALKVNDDGEETLAAIVKARELAASRTVRPYPETLQKMGEGWVGEEALAIAIYCALAAGADFDFGVRLAVNHGGDSDSTGAIAGNILGALLGRKAIGEEWLKQIELIEVIKQISVDLFLGFQDSDEWWRRYPGH